MFKISKSVKCLLVLALSLAAVTFLQCSDDKNPVVPDDDPVPILDADSLFGSWNWEISYYCGYNLTPDSLGYTKAILLYEDSSYEEYRDDTLYYSGHFTVKPMVISSSDFIDTLLLLSVDGRSESSDSLYLKYSVQDTLILEGVPILVDGYIIWREATHVYTRMK